MKRTSLGWNQSLFILPFDHRAAFAEMAQDVPAAKRVVYEGFLEALGSIDAQHAGILVDEESSVGILKDAHQKGYITACPAEKSGQPEFHFEYGEGFSAHLDAMAVTFVKVLVRYNPEGDVALNQRQSKRLARLSADCDSSGRRMMFELLVPATDAQVAVVGGDRKRFDLETRPGLTVRAMQELLGDGVEPDIWKVEGVESPAAFDSFVKVARSPGGKRSRADVGIIILGRGETLETVKKWIGACAGRPGATGIAVGRTLWEEPVRAFAAGKMPAVAAAQEIAKRFSELCLFWKKQASRS